ncbi:TPA: hypothetical protein I7715_20860 [Vibrio vulnificus]|nr:hypothetical protein [Vibrio vulnificus]
MNRQWTLTTISHFSANKAFKSDSQRLAVSLRSSIAKRRSHLNAALGLPREKHHYWEKDLGISLAICLRLSANQLGLPKSSRFFSCFSCQNSWVASLENRVGWLKVSGALVLLIDSARTLVLS